MSKFSDMKADKLNFDFLLTVNCFKMYLDLLSLFIFDKNEA